ncbi:hypothetical protein FM107_09035 [Sphingobacterium sp. JB170]|nr:hypothetical protein FM107_09035 [Sphingobacterium sp. JB170]
MSVFMPIINLKAVLFANFLSTIDLIYTVLYRFVLPKLNI